PRRPSRTTRLRRSPPPARACRAGVCTATPPGCPPRRRDGASSARPRPPPPARLGRPRRSSAPGPSAPPALAAPRSAATAAPAGPLTVPSAARPPATGLPRTGPAGRPWSADRARSADLLEDEGRVARGDRGQLLVGRVRADATEEDADLRLPPPQVGPQHRDLLVVGQFDGPVVRPPAPEQQVQLAAGGPRVAHPLPVAARRDEVLPAVERQQVDRGAPGLAADPAAD